METRRFSAMDLQGRKLVSLLVVPEAGRQAGQVGGREIDCLILSEAKQREACEALASRHLGNGGQWNDVKKKRGMSSRSGQVACAWNAQGLA